MVAFSPPYPIMEPAQGKGILHEGYRSRPHEEPVGQAWLAHYWKGLVVLEILQAVTWIGLL